MTDKPHISGTVEGPAKRKTECWAHQSAAYDFAFGKSATMLAMDMGTGKSKVVVDLAVNWGCKTILILCPVSVRNVWRREFAQHAGEPVNVIVLEKGTVATKMERAAEAVRLATLRNEAVAVVVNYESAWRLPFGPFALGTDWDLVVLDESHRCKGHRTQIGKFVDRLRLQAKRRLCLTGTPMPASPLDVFGQYRFLDPGIFGRYWTRFKRTYARCQNAAIPQMITSYQNLDDLQERFARLAYRVSADVLDLPPVSHDVRAVEVSPKARKAYNELANEFITDLEGGYVTASNALVKTLRLRQVVSGFLQLDETETLVELDYGKETALLDLLADLPSTEPVVVFAEFRHDLDVIRRVAAHLGRHYGELSGRQHDLTQQATIPPEIQILGAQYQSGGVGIDLTAARYAVYFSPTYNLANYEQSLARLHRPGQRGHVQYYHLVAENTIDEVVYKALEKKRNVIEEVMAVFKQERRVAC